MMIRRVLFAALLLLSPAAVDAQPARITFELVPVGAWVDGRPDLSRKLLEGWVYLYRVGAAEPELTLHLGQAREVPDGDWVWIAEGPGYMSTVRGELTLRAADPDLPGGLELVIGAGEDAEVVDLSGLSPEEGIAVRTISD